MINIFLQSLYFFMVVIILSLLEIQIEGAHPWAEKLPTWRKKIFGFNKDITGYHVYLSIFILLLFHLPFLFGLNYTISNELKILSIIVLIAVYEDFLWNIINPNPKYGIIKFKKNYIGLIDKFFFSIPVDYLISIILSSLFASIANEIRWWTINFIIFLILTIVLSINRYYIDLKNVADKKI